eukprot:COSAG06_NODE_43815_length_368_cov_1.684015_1_plen_122_part_11
MMVRTANERTNGAAMVVQGMQLLIAIATLLPTTAAPKSPAAAAAAAVASKPSMVFFLTDDQDLIIGGFDRMEKTKRLIGDRGATFSNALVHSRNRSERCGALFVAGNARGNTQFVDSVNALV